MSKRCLSEIEANDDNTAPPAKKMKCIGDKMLSVVIGKKRMQFSSKSLSKMPYFEAKLSQKWSGVENDVIVISEDEEFCFSVDDLFILLTFCDENKLIIPTDLDPSTTFLSLMNCANFFCVKVHDKTIEDYYKNCKVLIGNDTLEKWSLFGIPSIANFASRTLKSRRTEMFAFIRHQLDRFSSRFNLESDPLVSSKFSYIAKLLLENIDESFLQTRHGLIDIGNPLRTLTQKLTNAVLTISAEKFDVVSKTAVGIASTLIELLNGFKAYEKLFEMMLSYIIQLMVKLCDTAIIERFTAKLKNSWAELSFFLFKTPRYNIKKSGPFFEHNQQIRGPSLRATLQLYSVDPLSLVEVVYFVNNGLFVFMDDENIMKKILQFSNNENGMQFAKVIMRWKANYPSKKGKYKDFCSKYFKE